MKRRKRFTVGTGRMATHLACGFMALAAVIRLWHYLPQSMDAFTFWVHMLMPTVAAVLFVVTVPFGKTVGKVGAIVSTVLGVAFFILKATTFEPLHQTLCTILYSAVLVLFCGTLLGLFPTKKLLYPLFSLPLGYHILVEDTQAYFFADPPVPVWYWMPEISVLCIMTGLLCLSVGLQEENHAV